MARPPKIIVTYCAECGYEDEALGLVRALMLEFAANISSIELVPWGDGTYDVSVGGTLVHSMARDGGFAEHERVKTAVREMLSA